MPAEFAAMEHEGATVRRRSVLALLLVLLTPLPAMEAAAGGFTEILVVEDEFTGFPSGPILPYTPFDASLGLLRSAEVTVEGLLELLMFLPPIPPDPAPAYHLEVEKEMTAPALSRGFGFYTSNIVQIHESARYKLGSIVHWDADPEANRAIAVDN